MTGRLIHIQNKYLCQRSNHCRLQWERSSAIALPQVVGRSPQGRSILGLGVVPPLSPKIGLSSLSISLGISFHNRHQSSLIYNANLLSCVTLFPYQERKIKGKSLISQLVHCPFFSVFLFSFLFFLIQFFICVLKDNPLN